MKYKSKKRTESKLRKRKRNSGDKRKNIFLSTICLIVFSMLNLLSGKNINFTGDKDYFYDNNKLYSLKLANNKSDEKEDSKEEYNKNVASFPMNEDMVSKENVEKDIKKEYIPNTKDIVNIALLGLDYQDENSEGADNSRADAIMILTLDTKNKKVKLSSLLRDSYVNIKGYGMDKLNHAYAFGGSKLLLDTINKNYNLGISDYISINFSNFESMIDEIDGVDIYLTKEEIEYLNSLQSEGDDKYQAFNSPKEYLLNGLNAMNYARNRSSLHGDIDRTKRQRNLIVAIYKKIRDFDSFNLIKFVGEYYNKINTDLSVFKMMNLATDILFLDNLAIEQNSFPAEGDYENTMINGVFYLQFDIEKTKNKINNFIYYDEKLEMSGITE